MPLSGGVRKPVQRVGRAGAGGGASKPGGGPWPRTRPTTTCASVRVSTGVPLQSGFSNTSALRPATPPSVVSAEVGTGRSGRRKVVPGSKTTRAFGNCFWMPASAVVESEGQPL